MPKKSWGGGGQAGVGGDIILELVIVKIHKKVGCGGCPAGGGGVRVDMNKELVIVKMQKKTRGGVRSGSWVSGRM